MKATLTTDISWRGVLYETGDRDIPEDLAIALGVIEPPLEQKRELTITSTDPVADLQAIDQIIQAIEPLTKPSKLPRRKGM